MSKENVYLIQAKAAYNNGDLDKALYFYSVFQKERPELAMLVEVNIKKCKKKFNKCSANSQFMHIRQSAQAAYNSYGSSCAQDKNIISIVVPTYNVCNYLNECLISIDRQTIINNIEIICVNDGSTDGSADILYSFAASRKNVRIINQPNSGYGAAVNAGIRKAQGKYIGIVEPDDYIASNMFESLLYLAEENEADIARGTAIAFTKEGPIDKLYGQAPDSCNSKLFNLSKHPEILTVPPAIWAAIYNKNFLLENNIKLPESPGASFQDVAFFLQSMIAAKKVVTTWHPYYFYRNDNPGASRFSKGKIDVIFDMYDWLLTKTNLIDTSWSPFMIRRIVNDFKWSYNRVADGYKSRYMNNAYISLNKLSRLHVDFSTLPPPLMDFYKKAINNCPQHKPETALPSSHKDMPIVSIVVPVYNAEAYIEEFLNSITSQDNYGYELILVNDQSRDKTLSILTRYNYKNLPIKIISLDKNSGASVARNAGLEHAKGSYVRFVDCDDIIPYGSLAYMREAIKKYKSDVVKGQLWGYNYKEGKKFKNYWGNREYKNEADVNLHPSLCPSTWNLYDHQAYVIRRSLLLDNNIQYPVLKNYQDPPVMAAVLAAANSVTVLPLNAYYLVCNRGITTITRSKWNIENYRSLIKGLSSALYALSRAGLYMVVKYKLNTFLRDWIQKLTDINECCMKKECNEIFEDIVALSNEYSYKLTFPEDSHKLKILEFILLQRQFDDAQSYLNLLKRQDKEQLEDVDLLYYPFWDEKNPYLNLIYESNKERVRRGNLIDALSFCALRDKKEIIFHLHWTDLLIQRVAQNEKHAYSFAYYYIGLLKLFTQAGGRLVWTMHNYIPHETKYLIAEKILISGIIDNAETIIVHSEAGKKYIIDEYNCLYDKKIKIAPHGNYLCAYRNDTDRRSARNFFDLKESETLFMFFGQIRSYKGIDSLIRAFNEVAASNSLVRLAIVGQCPDRKYLSKLSELIDSRVASRVTTVAKYIADDEISKYVNAADFIVLPYKSILTSGTVLLAFGFKCPVIAPSHDGLKDIIHDGINGYIYQDNLAAALSQAAETPLVTRLSLKENAYQTALSNDWSDMRGLINSIINTKE